MTPTVKTLGDRIRELREQRDLSLRELAKKLDVSAAFVSDVELGRRHPSDDLFARLAALLKTNLEDLRQYDARAPIQELKRRAATEPGYGIALRTMIKDKVTSEELGKFLKNRSHRD